MTGAASGHRRIVTLGLTAVALLILGVSAPLQITAWGHVVLMNGGRLAGSLELAASCALLAAALGSLVARGARSPLEDAIVGAGASIGLAVVGLAYARALPALPSLLEGHRELTGPLLCMLATMPGFLLGAHLAAAHQVLGARDGGHRRSTTALPALVLATGAIAGLCYSSHAAIASIGARLTGVAGAAGMILAAIPWGCLGIRELHDDERLPPAGAEHVGPGGRLLAGCLGALSMGFFLLGMRVTLLIAGPSIPAHVAGSAIWIFIVLLGYLAGALWPPGVSPSVLAGRFAAGAGVAGLASLPFYHLAPIAFLLPGMVLGWNVSTITLATTLLAAFLLAPGTLAISLVAGRLSRHDASPRIAREWMLIGAGLALAAGRLGLASLAGTALSLQLSFLALLVIGVTLASDGRMPDFSPQVRTWVILVLGLVVFPPVTRNWLDSIAGTDFAAQRPRDFVELGSIWNRSSNLMIERLIDHPTGIVACSHGAAHLELLVDGRMESRSVQDLDSRVLLAELPLLAHPDPHHVLVIGMGMGLTPGAILLHPVTTVTCAEPSVGVLRCLDYFSQINGRPETDPRVRILRQDGSQVLAETADPYDVIVIGPTRPWVTGGSLTYSVEFLRECRKHLAPGGLIARWCPIVGINPQHVQLIGRTMLEVFPEMRVFQDPVGACLILIGARDAGTLSARPFAERVRAGFAVPGVKRTIESVEIRTPFTLLCSELYTPGSARRWVGPGEILSIDRPLLELETPAAIASGAVTSLPAQIAGEKDSLVTAHLAGRHPSVDELLDLSRYRQKCSNYMGLTRLLTAPDTPDDVRLWLRAIAIERQLGHAQETLSIAREAVRRFPKSVECADAYYDAALAIEASDVWPWKPSRFTETRKALEQLRSFRPKDPSLILVSARLLLQIGDRPGARREIEEYGRIPTQIPADGIREDARLWVELAVAHRDAGELSAARDAASRGSRVSPSLESATALVQELSSTSTTTTTTAPY